MPTSVIVMSDAEKTEASIPLIEERVTVDKRVVETGRVRIRSVVDEKLVRVSEVLERDDVTIERVAVNREVTEAPEPREDNGVLIVPLLEEVVVVEKRLVLREELHIRRVPKRERVEEAVRLRKMRAEVDRVGCTSVADNTSVERQPEPPSGSRGPGLHRKEPVRQRRKGSRENEAKGG
jgi:uncharacterized protein (TIGR02271 family)